MYLGTLARSLLLRLVELVLFVVIDGDSGVGSGDDGCGGGGGGGDDGCTYGDGGGLDGESGEEESGQGDPGRYSELSILTSESSRNMTGV